MVHANFTFNPIGQGGFYTGNISKHRWPYGKFNFVYDCGRKKIGIDNLEESINRFKGSLPRIDDKTRKLDLLILSHIDEDHVNGVKQLLTGVKCEHIYMPYLTPIQRLFIALRNDIVDNEDYIEFIISPNEYLFKVGGDEIEIVYILGNQDDEFQDNENTTEDPIDIEKVIFNFEDSLEPVSIYDLPSEIVDKVKFKKGNKGLKIGLIWEFYLYNEPIDSNKIKLFENAILSILNTEDFSKNDLVRILRDAKLTTKLRKIYKDKKIFKDTNSTSLIVQHKPMCYESAFFYKERYSMVPYHYFRSYNRNFIKNKYRNNSYSLNKKWGSTLLTGDINLDKIQNSKYIKYHLPECKVLQVPHHGSDLSWKSGLYKEWNNRGMTSAIINFGYGNTYGHPGSGVLNDLDENNYDTRFCTQFESFNYHIHLLF